MALSEEVSTYVAMIRDGIAFADKSITKTDLRAAVSAVRTAVTTNPLRSAIVDAFPEPVKSDTTNLEKLDILIYVMLRLRGKAKIREDRT